MVHLGEQSISTRSPEEEEAVPHSDRRVTLAGQRERPFHAPRLHRLQLERPCVEPEQSVVLPITRRAAVDHDGVAELCGGVVGTGGGRVGG